MSGYEIVSQVSSGTDNGDGTATFEIGAPSGKVVVGGGGYGVTVDTLGGALAHFQPALTVLGSYPEGDAAWHLVLAVPLLPTRSTWPKSGGLRSRSDVRHLH